MDRVSFTEFQQNLARYLDQAVDDCAPILVTREGGKGTVVVISADDFAGWEETVFLMRDPVNAAHLIASIESIKHGEISEHELIYPAVTAGE